MAKTVLITGASTGIGFALAKLFAQNNYALILVGQNKERLDAAVRQLGSTNVTQIISDLSNPSAAENIFNQIKSVDILVNNAGIGVYGMFQNTSWNDEERMMDVNMRTLVHLTKLFLPGMIERKNGKILNVASTAAFQPGPLMAIYYATKSFVLSFSEALANELDGSGVTVTALCPGPTATQFQTTAKMDTNSLFNDAMSVEIVARAGYNGLMKGKTIVIPGFTNRLFVQLLRILPRKTVIKIVRKLQ